METGLRAFREPVVELELEPALEPKPTSVIEIIERVLEISDRIHFEFNETRLSPRSERMLDAIAATVRTNPSVKIMIEGSR